MGKARRQKDVAARVFMEEQAEPAERQMPLADRKFRITWDFSPAAIYSGYGGPPRPRESL